MNIKLYAKRVYGVVRYYPDCPLSEAIAGIKKLPTLTYKDLRSLQLSGLNITLTLADGSTISDFATAESAAIAITL